LEQIHAVMELAQSLNKKIRTLDAVIHQFSGTLGYLGQHVPPPFGVYFDTQADGNGVMLESL